ncbi:hypothetical protein AGMMS49579_01010 [Spirochaetia bacterium]|nr:hypothetical protein AGMMS49579_01010 [Spirochaetia bacterium]
MLYFVLPLILIILYIILKPYSYIFKLLFLILKMRILRIQKRILIYYNYPYECIKFGDKFIAKIIVDDTLWNLVVDEKDKDFVDKNVWYMYLEKFKINKILFKILKRFPYIVSKYYCDKCRVRLSINGKIFDVLFDKPVINSKIMYLDGLDNVTKNVNRYINCTVKDLGYNTLTKINGSKDIINLNYDDNL